MKIRTGFVSNSSSSSFVCDVSGVEESGWDMCLSDLGWYECEGGHVFDSEYLDTDLDTLSKEEVLKYLKEQVNLGSTWRKDTIRQIEELSEEKFEEEKESIICNDLEWRYSLPSKYCPICNLNVLTIDDKIQYLIKKTNITKDEVFKSVKEKNKRRKKLRPFEYLNYVKERHPETVNEEALAKEAKEKFKTYEAFHSYIWG